MLNKAAILIKQGRFSFYLLAVSGKELLENSTIEYFRADSQSDLGYQRPIVKSHYTKLSRYLQGEDAILPPAIIAALESDKLIYNASHLQINGKLRVVDGQHRIEAIKALESISFSDYRKASEFEFPVIVMSIGVDDKIHEINTFIHINQRGKKVNTNLAVSITERLRLQLASGKLMSFKECTESIAAMICNGIALNKESVWYDVISFGDEISQTKPVSINLFSRSLIPVISSYLTKNMEIPKDHMFNNEEINSYSAILLNLVVDVWKRIENKWPKCFNKSDRKYNNAFNIQKGVGVMPFHILLTECMNDANGSISDASNNFSTLLNECELTFVSWRSGGRFSGYNSKRGFEIIASVIKNNQELPTEDEDEELF